MPRNRKSPSKKGSPGWMTTYADMVTLLLCFFVLLYSFSNLDVQKFQAIMSAFQGSLGVLTGGRTVSGEQVIGSPPLNISRTMQLTDMEIEQIQNLYQRLTDMIETGELPGSVELELENRGLVIRFADRLFFDLGRAQLTEEAVAVLDLLTPILRDLPNHVRIEGHTDDLPINNDRFPSNWELSTARATTVIRYLIERKGFSPSRLSAAGYSQYRPLAPNSEDSGRMKNRRVDMVILRLGLSQAEPAQRLGVDTQQQEDAVAESNHSELGGTGDGFTQVGEVD